MANQQREALISFAVEVKGEEFLFVSRQLKLPATPKNVKVAHFEVPYLDVRDSGAVLFLARTVEQSGDYWDEEVVQDALSRLHEHPEAKLLTDEEQGQLNGILTQMSDTLAARAGWFHVHIND